jgi:hypothetical protein
MEKRHIIRFLKKGKRGSYTLLAKMYSDLFMSMSTTMAIELVQEELSKESGEEVKLHYFSVVRAVARFKKKFAAKNIQAGNKTAIEFKNSHEINNGQLGAGQFQIEEP